MIRHISIETKRQARQASMRLSFHNGDILAKKTHNDFSLWAFLRFKLIVVATLLFYSILSYHFTFIFQVITMTHLTLPVLFSVF